MLCGQGDATCAVLIDFGLARRADAQVRIRVRVSVSVRIRVRVRVRVGPSVHK